MSSNTKQGLIVIGLTFGVLACWLAVGTIRQSRLNEEMMVSSVQTGLEDLFDQCRSGLKDSNQHHKSLVEPSDIRRVLVGADGSPREPLPSFVSLSDVFIPYDTIPIPTNALFCVVRMPSGRLYGITGQRSWQFVTSETFATWHHQALKQQAN
jgi:hypothetical protein